MTAKSKNDSGSLWGECHVGELVLAEMQRQGMLQIQLAGLMGMSPQGLGKLLQRADWRYVNMAAACKALGIDLFHLMSEAVVPRKLSPLAVALEECKAQVVELQLALTAAQERDGKEIDSLRKELKKAQDEVVRLGYEVEKQMAVVEALKGMRE